MLDHRFIDRKPRATQRPGSLTERLKAVHAELRRKHPEITRVSVAIYDRETDILKTFIHSTDADTENPFEFYEAALSTVPSLLECAERDEPRVINDLPSSARTRSRRRIQIINAGIKSSYTVPLSHGDRLLGFLFFDARDPGFFTATRLEEVETYADLIAAFVAWELHQVDTLHNALGTVTEVSWFRDEETGAHLERMARLSSLIGRTIAPGLGLNEEFVEFVSRFAPLHDIGKIAIPDRILLKPGRLTDEEFQIMKTHVDRGREIIETVIDNFHLHHIRHVELLRNIVDSHHEALDGTGYPQGRVGDRIPLEARIVAVADVFDALTNNRPYKEAWPIADALSYLKSQAGLKFNADAVEALASHPGAVEAIQARFKDNEPFNRAAVSVKPQ